MLSWESLFLISSHINLEQKRKNLCIENIQIKFCKVIHRRVPKKGILEFFLSEVFSETI